MRLYTGSIMSPIAENLQEVRGRISEALQGDSRAVTLVAVSKTHPPGMVREAFAAGQRDFGENRVQEAKAKWPELKARFPGTRLHLIGPLQSNKAREAIELFDSIHSIDRPKIARAIADEMARQGRRLELFVQVNTGEEPQKAGVVPRELPALLALCRDELKLEIAGLMCIPPVDEEPAVHFAFLAKLARENGLAGLSMGMSDDFTTAVELGATDVRVGSAIFGSRPLAKASG